jgi:hypothetical protein
LQSYEFALEVGGTRKAVFQAGASRDVLDDT